MVRPAGGPELADPLGVAAWSDHEMVVAREDVVDLAAQRAAGELGQSPIPANSSCFRFRRPEFMPRPGAFHATSSASSVSIVVVSFVSNAENTLTTWASQTAPIGPRPLIGVASQNRRGLEAEVDR
ncbi:MAG TPA: hypothetical protein VGL16_08800 [Actinomycetota bacterium]|jgi:hypothetical protein